MLGRSLSRIARRPLNRLLTTLLGVRRRPGVVEPELFAPTDLTATYS